MSDRHRELTRGFVAAGQPHSAFCRNHLGSSEARLVILLYLLMSIFYVFGTPIGGHIEAVVRDCQNVDLRSCVVAKVGFEPTRL